MDFSRKKANRESLGIWNFQGCQGNSMQNLQRLIKNEVEFPAGMIKKKSCEIFRALGFFPRNFHKVKHIFMEFLMVKLCFVQNFEG